MFVSTTYGSAPTSGGKNELCVRVRAFVCSFVRLVARTSRSRVRISVVHAMWRLLSRGGCEGASYISTPSISYSKILSPRDSDEIFVRFERGVVLIGDFTNLGGHGEQSSVYRFRENPGRSILSFINLSRREGGDGGTGRKRLASLHSHPFSRPEIYLRLDPLARHP